MLTKALSKLIGFFLMPVSMTLFISSFFNNDDFLLFPVSISVMLLANVLILISDLKNNVLFIVFQGTFFLFLVAGPLVYSIEGENFFANFSDGIIKTTYICYWLTASVMWCFIFIKSILKRRYTVCLADKKNFNRDYEAGNIRYISRIAFYISIFLYFVVIIDKILFRQVYSLTAYYAEYSQSSNIPMIFVKMADCHIIALCIFLATKPTKKEAKMLLMVFLIVSAMSLFYGVRNVFILNLLFVVVYCILRNGDNDEIWLSRKITVMGIMLSPIALIFLQAFDVIRRSIAFNMFDIKELFSFSLIKDFLVSQSVSSNILPNAIRYSSYLGDQPVPYSIGSLYIYLRQNMITRLFTGEASFSANSVESALSGANLGTRLSYILYRDSFLSGTGMGSSFVAELYVDFSYTGVVVGTIMVCIIISLLTKVVNNNDSPYWLAFSFVAVKWLAYMPRDSLFAWAMQAFSFMNILFLALIACLERMQIPRIVLKKTKKY